MTRSVVSWLAGAVLFVFFWWVVAAILGSDVASVVFVPLGVALLARQYLRRRSRRVSFADAD